MTVIKMLEEVSISNLDENLNEITLARIDTGAAKSSIDVELAANLKLGPIIETSKVRNSHGKSVRPVVKATITIQNKKVTEKFTIANRSNMKYKVLVGRNILNKGFLIDPSKGKKK